MNMRFSIVLALACLLPVGCRMDPRMDAYIQELHAEHRMLEDDINNMQYEYEAQLEKLRSENARLGGNAGNNSSGDEGPNIMQPDINPGIPEINPGTPDSQKSILPTPKSDGGEGANLGSPDSHITHIVLNPRLSGGHDFDGKPGDDGVFIVLQPRNADDLFVPQAGSLSIVVLDPLKDGEAARVARWELDADDVKYRIRTTEGTTSGIHLKLPWSDDPPENTHLHVFLRYQTQDLRKLEADGELVVGLPGQFSHRWTPRPIDSIVSQRPDAPYMPTNTTGVPPVPSPTVSSLQYGQTVPDNRSFQPTETPAVQPIRQTSRLSRRDRLWKPYR